MKLYHGTDGRFLDHILRVGLRPRGAKGRNNWLQAKHPSNSKCVYLTDSYAPYFAFNAARGKTPMCAVVEVDTDVLDTGNLYPDEDFLEQIGRGFDGVPGDMGVRTLYYRRRQFSDHGLRRKEDGRLADWRDSLRALGTCVHRGAIPPHAITRACRWPQLGNRTLGLIWDPQISLLNQKLCGDRYKTLMKKLMTGEFCDPTTQAVEERHRAAFEPEHAIIPTILGFELIDAKKTGGAPHESFEDTLPEA